MTLTKFDPIWILNHHFDTKMYDTFLYSKSGNFSHKPYLHAIATFLPKYGGKMSPPKVTIAAQMFAHSCTANDTHWQANMTPSISTHSYTCRTSVQTHIPRFKLSDA